MPQGNAVYFYGYDGNGNVATLAKSDGTVAARYEYDPYGQVLRLSSVAGPGGIPGIGYENPFRFSTKRTDATSDLVHYEYRVYNPGTGRWLSRDPLEELGSDNLSAFLSNDGQNSSDFLGLIDRERNGPPSIVVVRTPPAPSEAEKWLDRQLHPERYGPEEETISGSSGKFGAGGMRLSSL